MTIQDRFEALAPRERRMLVVLLGVVGLLMILAVPTLVSLLLSDETDTHAQLLEAIQRIEAEGDGVRERQAEREALLARYETPVPALAGFLDKAAQASGITIPESKDPSPLAHGKKYEERFTSISLRKVGLLGLVKFMERVAGGPEPISITKLNVRKRGVEADAYDVEMTVSAYHRIAPKTKDDKAKPEDKPKAEDKAKAEEEQR